MLLPGSYRLLHKLRLSKADFPEVKRWFFLSERMARNMEQLTYLKTSRNANHIPPFINNIRLPNFFKEKSLLNATIYIKKYILQKSIRHLHGQIEKTRKKLSDAVETIFAANGVTKATAICGGIEEAFQAATQIHRNRLNKKLSWNRRKEEAKVTQIQEQHSNMDMVTDLTESLDEDEIALLSKGPKFAVSSAVNGLDVQANFCIVANQLRWAHYLHDRATDNTDAERPILPKYPNREYIYEPPSRNHDLETKLHICFTKIQRIMERAKSHEPMENLSLRTRDMP